MKITINCRDYEFPEGTKFIRIVEFVREEKKDEPMIKAIREKEGKDYLMFLRNGRIVKPEVYESLEIEEGDEVRWIHPYAGG